MSRVASQANAVHSHYHGASAHRPAAADGKQPSSPFAALLDTTPAPADRPERPQVGADSTGDANGDPRTRRADGKDRAPTDTDNTADDADAGTTDPVDAQAADQPVIEAAAKSGAKTGPKIGTESGENTDDVLVTDGTTPDDDKTTKVDVANIVANPGKGADQDAPAPQLATDQPAPVAPTIVAASVTPTIVAAPLAPPVAVAGKAAAAASDDTAIEPVGVLAAPTQGVADADGLVTRKGPNMGSNAPSTPDGVKIANTSKAPNAKADAGTAPAQGVSADSAQADVGPVPQAPAQAGSPAGTNAGSVNAAGTNAPGTNAAGKGEHASGRTVESNTATKADEPTTQPDIAGTLAVDKPADAAQLTTVPHSAQRTVTPTTASTAATANAAASVSTPAPIVVPVAGLAVAIASQAQGGRNRFEIRLDPPELGRIDVRLDVDRDGRVTSRLIADKAETLDLLRRDAPDLQRALQDAGLKTSDSGLQFTLRDQGFAGQNQDPSGNGRADTRIVVPDPDMPPVDAVQTSYGRALRVGGGIDIRV